jgi:hypothetical protein
MRYTNALCFVKGHGFSRAANGASIIDRSLIPMISAVCHHVIFLAIARNITSCTFIARSTAALG